ncbi:MAG: Regulator of chromosome condensation (RCC1) repeat protein [Firmicutes bacterium ADurb.Bin153]|nr:MAG: Regulator of chromosome condensation (RCC1) repeat protein [Firmicutes bacterium ADurb.Bin153]
MRRTFAIALIFLCTLTAGCSMTGGAPYAVSGRIVSADDESLGIGDTIVSFSGIHSVGTTVSNDDGTWNISNIRGNVTIAPLSAGWAFEPAYRQVHVTENGVDFHAIPSASNNLGFRQVAAGNDYVLLLSAEGDVYFWGALGSVYTYGAALRVPGIENIVAVAAGAQHCLALKGDGTVWAWGANGRGQLGDGTYLDSFNGPVKVDGISEVMAVAAGESHSLAVRTDGTVWGWGDNSAYQIGRILPRTIASPALKPEIDGVVSVAACSRRSVAVKADGSAWQWGNWLIGMPMCGAIYWMDRYVSDPEDIGLKGIVAVAAGFQHSVALKDDGTVWAWGMNSQGQLGNGISGAGYGPYRIPGPDQAIAVAAGVENGLAVAADGSVWAWGANPYNYLGTGSSSMIIPPRKVEGIASATTIAAGSEVIVASDGFGDLWHWGMSYPGASPYSSYILGNPRKMVVH